MSCLHLVESHLFHPLTSAANECLQQNEIALCGVQLDLVQAAHIVPVSHDEGTDHTSNGIALCALHHYAYDRGLIFIDEEYLVEINQKKIDKLRSMSRDDGLEEFTDALRALIILPPTISDRPHIEYLRIANALRLAA